MSSAWPSYRQGIPLSHLHHTQIGLLVHRGAPAQWGDLSSHLVMTITRASVASSSSVGAALLTLIWVVYGQWGIIKIHGCYNWVLLDCLHKIVHWLHKPVKITMLDLYWGSVTMMSPGNCGTLWPMLGQGHEESCSIFCPSATLEILHTIHKNHT